MQLLRAPDRIRITARCSHSLAPEFGQEVGGRRMNGGQISGQLTEGCKDSLISLPQNYDSIEPETAIHIILYENLYRL